MRSDLTSRCHIYFSSCGIFSVSHLGSDASQPAESRRNGRLGPLRDPWVWWNRFHSDLSWISPRFHPGSNCGAKAYFQESSMSHVVIVKCLFVALQVLLCVIDEPCGWSCFVGVFLSTCSRFICERSARPFVHRPTQKPLLHKLLSSFNLRELYLFIICSQAVPLRQGIVSRGNLSLPLPSFLPSSCYSHCLQSCFVS